MDCGVLQFEDIEIDLEQYELRLSHRVIGLERQPMELLILLAERSGHLVTREEIVARLWDKNTFLDTDQSINSAIRKIRAALKDDPERPRYVLTVVGKGYRFIAPVKPGSGLSNRETPIPSGSEQYAPPTAGSNSGRNSLFLASAVALSLVAGLLFFAGAKWGRPTSLHPIRSVAVLPLENLSGDASQEYFSDGMTDEIITDLARIGALRVISRTSVMQYKGTRKPLPQIAHELHVDAVVEGSVIRSGNRVRIRSQLVDGRTDKHLWAESYERDLVDVITLQTEVANAIADRIQGKLSASEQVRPTASHAVDLKAYEAYLKGRYFWAKYTAEGWKKGIEYFNQAIEIDPSYARAYAGLADCYLRLGAFGEMSVDDAMPKGEAAARKALEIDGTLGEAHFASAFGKTFYDFDWNGAEQEFQRALQLDPGNAIGHMTYSVYLSALGRPNNAIEELKRALELDPLSLIINTNLARAYHFAGEDDKAVEQCGKALALEPSFEAAHTWLAVAYWGKGMYRESVQENQAALVRSGKAELADELGHVFAVRGHRGVQEWELQTTLKYWQKAEAEASDVAMAYAALGKNDEAFEWLEKARTARDAPIALVKAMRSYDSLRSDPRYPEFLHRMKLPQ